MANTRNGRADSILVGAIVFAVVAYFLWHPTQPNDHPSDIGSQPVAQTVQQSDGAKMKDAVATFMKTWLESGSEAAVAQLDERTIDATRDLVHGKLKGFDGTISDLGEGEITVYATGVQYPTNIFEVKPVTGDSPPYIVTTYQISVAKDTKKVIWLKPTEINGNGLGF